MIIPYNKLYTSAIINEYPIEAHLDMHRWRQTTVNVCLINQETADPGWTLCRD